MAEEYQIVGHDTKAVSSSAVSLTTSGSNITQVTIRVNDATIRWRADGTAPTASEGHTQSIGDIFVLTDETEVSNFQAIRKGSTDSEIDCIYEKRLP
mgnify:FL=1|jgi:hypothetical protein